MEQLDALALASSHFVSVLDRVRADQLGAPTPCEEWDVRALLRHVSAGGDMAIALLDGASAEEARSYFTQEYSDAVSACRDSVAAQRTRMDAVTDWGLVVHHVVGDVPASQLLGFRIADLTLHSWDLATAIGADTRLPDDLAALAYEQMKPMESFIGEIGMFGTGPSGSVDEGADAQRRLLDLSGRRP